MDKKVINIGLIGCGWIVEHGHIPALIEVENIVIKACFDIQKDRAIELSNKIPNIKAYDKIEDFLICGLDGVVIATPNYTHIEYTLMALEKGINVLCEKPIVLNSTDANKLIEVAKQQHCILVPGFVNRWRKDVQQLRKIIINQEIGKIYEVQAGWLRKNGVPRPGSWFTKRKYAGGGVLLDLGSHIMDICLMLIEERNIKECQLITTNCNPEKMKKGGANWFRKNVDTEFEIDVEDSAIVNVLFEEDINLKVKLSWCAQIEADCTYFTIIGEKGTVYLKSLFGFSKNKLWKEDILKVIVDGKEKVYEFDETINKSRDAFKKMHEYFYNAIITKKALKANAQDALKIVSLTERLYTNNRQDELKIREDILEDI